MKKKNPIIGGIGIVLMLFSVVLCAATAGQDITPAAIIAILGAGVLIYALVTGNINFLG